MGQLTIYRSDNGQPAPQVLPGCDYLLFARLDDTGKLKFEINFVWIEGPNSPTCSLSFFSGISRQVVSGIEYHDGANRLVGVASGHPWRVRSMSPIHILQGLEEHDETAMKCTVLPFNIEWLPETAGGLAELNVLFEADGVPVDGHLIQQNANDATQFVFREDGTPDASVALFGSTLQHAVNPTLKTSGHGGKARFGNIGEELCYQLVSGRTSQFVKQRTMSHNGLQHLLEFKKRRVANHDYSVTLTTGEPANSSDDGTRAEGVTEKALTISSTGNGRDFNFKSLTLVEFNNSLCQKLKLPLVVGSGFNWLEHFSSTPVKQSWSDSAYPIQCFSVTSK